MGDFFYSSKKVFYMNILKVEKVTIKLINYLCWIKKHSY